MLAPVVSVVGEVAVAIASVLQLVVVAAVVVVGGGWR